MRLGLFLALVATALALDCNIGNVVLEDGVITSKFLKHQPCAGMCSRVVFSTGNKDFIMDFIMLSCQENEVSIFKYTAENNAECSATELGTTCLCSESFCSDWKAEENLVPLPEVLDDNTQPICYVGYYSNNGVSTTLNSGATTTCAAGQACAFISGSLGNTALEAYLCTTTAVCQQAIGKNDGNGTINGDNVQMTCCTQANCTGIVTNPAITVPQTVTQGNNTINCLQGAQLNYANLGDFFSLPCSGSCSSVSIKTYVGSGRNTQIRLLDLYTCDPVAVCDAVNLNNGCGNLVLNNTNSLLRGCCCNTNNCIDPTQQPPVFPTKQLKCYTGIYVPSTGYTVGAEMACTGKCGRIDVPVGDMNVTTTIVKYMSCFPYSICQGLGIGDGDQSYNPPMDEETTVTCCSSKDNCNISPYDLSQISYNVSVIPTTNYPILCYGNIHLNGVPMTTGSYSMCSGECAMASFQTTVFGQQHNTTIYTCDPATMCKSAGITNGCAQINGTGVTACCCDDDTCFDPNRVTRGSTNCYTGIYVKEDNYLNGGETLCDGWCASLSTIVNNKNTTTYWCAPVRVCRSLALGMGGDQNCNTIPNANTPLTGCCCAEGNNCNLPTNLLPNVTSVPVRREPPIVCYEAIHINGVPQGNPGYRICNGNCVSMQMGAKINGSAQSTTLYTCDSSASCNSMGLRNSCGSVDGTVYSCCCDTDACIDPTFNRSPDRNLKCYVGVNSNIVFAGTMVNCNGRCANITTSIGGTPFSTYHCVPNSFCSAVALDNACDVLQIDRALVGCCCDSSDGCNALGTNLTTAIPVSPPETPIACYSGLHINSTTWTAGSGWSTCMGDCMVLSINSSFNGQFMTASMYTCDPAAVCSQLNLTNTCGSPELGITGCCCDSDACIDPNYNRSPDRVLSCYVGVWNGATKMSMGVDSTCDGKCASIYTYYNNIKYKAYFCLNQKQAETLNVDNGCRKIPGDAEIAACVCDNANNCNVAADENVLQNPLNTNFTENPIACWNGLYVNGIPQGAVGWNGCKGMCASAQWQTSLNGTNHTLTFYTCDPAAACSAMGLINSCGQVDAIPGLTGCCCSSDACMDATSIYPKSQNLNCFAGIVTPWSSAPGGIMAGAPVKCNGRCGSLSSTLNGNNFTAYQCISTDVCQTLGIDGTCSTIQFDRAITGCCCSTGDYCNIAGININVTSPAFTEPAIACYSGFWVNGIATGDGGYVACQGQCASIRLTTALSGSPIDATLYTCDPAAVCSQLNISNSCGSPEPGVKGCCCDSDTCIDPNYNRYPGRILSCYVGVWNTVTNGSVGVYTTCQGTCASFATHQNRQLTKVYFCMSIQQSHWLDLDNACTRIPGYDAQICSCDNTNNCNVLPGETPSPNALNTTYDGPPITCWNGAYINGKGQGQAGWAVCTGNCASMQFNNTFNGYVNSFVFYTCDPVSACTSFGMSNSCGQVDGVPGLIGCCCDQNACMTGDSIYPKVTNTTSSTIPSPATIECYAGIVSNYSPNSGGIMAGAPVTCYGQCGSLVSTISGFNVTVYQCMPTNVCQSLALDNSCISLPGDRVVTACCCSTGDYCNIKGTTIVPSTPTYTEPAIVCYNGLWVDMTPISNGQYAVCRGKCSSIKITSIISGQEHTAELFTCDPATVCSQLNMTNNCYSPGPGIIGCCCDSDTCIDPQYNRYPHRSLSCYVGVWNGATGQSMGADSSCDGKCASVFTYVNNQKYKAYFCLSKQQTETLGVDNGCRILPGDQQIQACVCDDTNNCNVDTGENVLQNSSNVTFIGQPIACWNGLYVNGQAQGSVGWSGCNGMCAVIVWKTTFSGSYNTLTLYTCDPAAACVAMDLINSCGQVDAIPGLTGCCCSSDACMDATSIYPKSQNLNCFAGIVTPWSSAPGGIMAGATIKCNGRCSSLSSSINGNNFTAYQCISTDVCQTLGIDGTCSTIQFDRAITGCCCSTGDYCNIAGTNITVTTPTFTEPPIACYNGLWVNGNVAVDGGYVACLGKCASISLTTSSNGAPQTATLYTCDPATICSQLNVTNNCGSPEPGVNGCCCDTDACIDPNYERYPGRSLTCYVGVWNGATKNSMGVDTICDGKCASIYTYYNNIKYKAYFCLNQKQAETLNVDNGCRKIPGDAEIAACVCDNANNCNVAADENVLQNPLNTNFTENPIACWNGLYVNGIPQGAVGWNGCKGMCASAQWQTSLNGTNHTLTFYTCDPAAACSAMGLINSCGQVDAIPGLTGCCCSSDACMDAKSIYPKKQNLKCYAGIVTPWSTNDGGIMAGASVKCNGRCGSLSSTLNGYNFTAYQCIPTNVCQSLGIDGTCSTLTADRDITGCCCSTGDYCNIANTGISANPPTFTEPTIACYSGVWVNGKAIADGGYIGCQGKCASISLTTSLSGASQTAVLYTCDPAAVCSQLNLTNSCGFPEPGVKGCCCDSDTCIDPNYNRGPDQTLSCYIGAWNAATNGSVGAYSTCSGKCASISTYQNNHLYKVYFCLTDQQTESLGVDNGCTQIPSDRSIEACVCDDSSNCNVKPGEFTAANAPNVTYDAPPITCWSGTYVNGQKQGSVGWVGCTGNCASMQLNTTFQGSSNSFVLYTCDPAGACNALSMNNQCQDMDAIPGLIGCCCDQNACMNSDSIYPKVTNNTNNYPSSNSTTPPPTLTSMNCFSGIVTPWSTNEGGIMAGASVKCNGKCGLLSSTVSGYPFTAYQCIDTNVCKFLNIDNTCGTLEADRDITGCCCSNKDYCNIDGTGIPAPTIPSYSEPTIACYSGMWVNGNATADGGYTACQGKCASISITTYFSGHTTTATLYTCDPATVCSQLNVSNSCASPEPGIFGCCCDTNTCIDPNFNRYPGRRLSCYVGVWNGVTKQSVGADTLCDGKCASMSTYITNNKYKAYFCLNQKQTEALGVDNGCRTIPADPEIQACVCDDVNNCNVDPGENVLQNTINTDYSGNPIACWNGLYVNEQPQGAVGWIGCQGMCASIQWLTSLNGANHVLKLYTCDPAAACTSMGLSNNCVQLNGIPGLTGCCCSSDACMDSTSIYPKNQNLNCFAGIVTPWSSAPGGIMAGAAVKCSGRCATLASTLNGYPFTAYQCIPTNMCQNLLIDGKCGTLTADRDIKGCCCSSKDFCNIDGTGINPPTISNYTEPPISCYNGLWVNGNASSDGAYVSCQGKCASISMTTSLSGQKMTATIYTCDPTTVCTQFGLLNSCGSPEPGVNGCCCDSDACLDPNFNRSPDRVLRCYVGAWNAATNGSVGDYTTCDGKCASVSTIQNGKMVKVYFCLNAQQTESLGVDNGCTIIPADRSVEACVCDDVDNCNIQPGETPASNAVNITYDAPPITCWSGTYVNNVKQGQVGWIACTGNCASIQLNTTYNGTPNSLVLYTCDPAAACKAIGLSNSCNTVDGIPNLMGCCCDQNACMTSASIYPVTAGGASSPKPGSTTELPPVGTTNASVTSTQSTAKATVPTSKPTTSKVISTTTGSSSVFSISAALVLTVIVMFF